MLQLSDVEHLRYTLVEETVATICATLIIVIALRKLEEKNRLTNNNKICKTIIKSFQP